MDIKELKKKISELLKEFKSVKVSITKMGVLVEVFKGVDFIRPSYKQIICLMKVCNYLNLSNLFKIDKRIAFKLISIIDDITDDRIFILCHEEEQ